MSSQVHNDKNISTLCSFCDSRREPVGRPLLSKIQFAKRELAIDHVPSFMSEHKICTMFTPNNIIFMIIQNMNFQLCVFASAQIYLHRGSFSHFFWTSAHWSNMTNYELFFFAKAALLSYVCLGKGRLNLSKYLRFLTNSSAKFQGGTNTTILVIYGTAVGTWSVIIFKDHLINVSDVYAIKLTWNLRTNSRKVSCFKSVLN